MLHYTLSIIHFKRAFYCAANTNRKLNKMKVYAYIRVSTEMQTCENQEHEIRKYCRSHELSINKIVSESVSGTVGYENRRLGRMIRQMGKGDMLICTELSRLGRNMLMVMAILNECSARGISIHTIKDNFDLSDNINSKIIAFAFALAAEIERNLISQRTKEALAVRKMNGVKLGRPPGSSKKKVSFYNRMEEVLKMLEEGYNHSEIAAIIGIHRNTLKKYIREYAICRKK